MDVQPENSDYQGREFHDVNTNVQSIGPFESYPVTLNGWTIPNLEAMTFAGGTQVTLRLDKRFDLDVPAEIAGRVISFVADCIAVSMGYACHPREGRTMNPDASTEELMKPVPPRILPWQHMVAFGSVADESMLGDDHD